MTARYQQLIEQLNLSPHPEGGYYRRIYQNTHDTDTGFGERPLSTSIIYLLEGQSFSAFHRIRFDEIWYLGESSSGVVIHSLSKERHDQHLLIPDAPVHCVSADTWFAAELEKTAADDFALVYCVVSPGFDFADFELAESSMLNEQFPECRSVIERLCIR